MIVSVHEQDLVAELCVYCVFTFVLSKGTFPSIVFHACTFQVGGEWVYGRCIIMLLYAVLEMDLELLLMNKLSYFLILLSYKVTLCLKVSTVERPNEGHIGTAILSLVGKC